MSTGNDGEKSAKDASTLSNPNQTRAKNIDWKVKVDFEKRVLCATATYDIEIIMGCPAIELDTRGLDISAIQLDGTDVNDWVMDDEIEGKEHLGQRLSIPLSPRKNNSAKVVISYTTSANPEKCSAAQWLSPAQTSGKEYPYLFTQCQAIHARSIIPCYDSPMVKMTYTASITVPKWSTAVMSALPKDGKQSGIATSDDSDTHTFEFDQPVPIPSYLLALSVGQLASHDISPRCRIWCEPSILSAASTEFVQTEQFLQAAEDISSIPYAWQRYDLLVLPGSFPYGGMENPCLTFVTPTLLAGDGSLVSVIAHEIAHSWTGNLVTNRTWSHFWLNEGWTTWLQRRIMNRVEKVPHDMDLDAISGALALERDVELIEDWMTSLVLPNSESDPDESYSRVPYEKGFHLLYTLERMLGQETFLKLFTAYLKKYAYGTVTSEEFQEFCISLWKDDANRQDEYDQMKSFDWEKWLYGFGMPPLPDFNKSLAEKSEALAKGWVAFDQQDPTSPTKPPSADISDWSSARKVCFLDALADILQQQQAPSRKKLKISTLKLIQKCYGFHQSQNSEIIFRYCMLAVNSQDNDIYPVVIRFITSQGRMKFIRPLYRAMFACPLSRDIAIETFLEHKNFYHPIAVKMVAHDMTKAKKETALGWIKEKLRGKVSTLISVAAIVGVGAIVFRRTKTN